MSQLPPPPPPSLTPPRPIRPGDEVPDSQDNDQGHPSDFEDLLKEDGAGQGRETDTGIEMARETVAETGTETEPSTTTPSPAGLALSSTTALRIPEPGLRDASPPPPSLSLPALPIALPSTAAHTLHVTKPPVSGDSTGAPAQSRPQPQAAQTTSPSPTLPAPPSSPASRRLITQIENLHAQILTLTSQLTASNALLPNPALAPAIVESHIKLLHSYNEIKDVGLGLMGLIADGRGVRLGVVMEECGVGERD
jgi:DNA repair protein Swi5/Sae3